MDARLKNIMDNYDKMRIGLDDTFRFHCTMCGRCCINREDILLTPRDMYRMAKELEITSREFFDRYCETYLGGDSRMPVVRLKPRGSVQRCPLLKDRKCSVHRAKPTVCALFPIGAVSKQIRKIKLLMLLKQHRLSISFPIPDAGIIPKPIRFGNGSTISIFRRKMTFSGNGTRH